jgi:phosphoenolpyruvate-protein phosphotransferase (PTS system enzyme I)
MPMRSLRGVPVSPGLAFGRIQVMDPTGRPLPSRVVSADRVSTEKERLDLALDRAHSEALAAEQDASQRLGPQYAEILGAHARMIDDPELKREAHERMDQENLSAEHAILEVLDGRASRLEQMSHSYFSARAADLRDIMGRILDQLQGSPPTDSEEAGPVPMQTGLILAHDLSPSQTAALDPSRVLGFGTEVGGRTSHTAIVANALRIPAVVGLGSNLLVLAHGANMAIIDGDEGLVILDPDTETWKHYERESQQRSDRRNELRGIGSLPSITRDGSEVVLWGNIEFPEEAECLIAEGAEGVGLYRTEFLYLGSDRPPSEDVQLAAFRAILHGVRGRPVTIRTLDLGTDKLPTYMKTAASRAGDRPLGLRSIRLSLREPEFFRTQLRAILRAAGFGPVRVMFPLVTTLEEWRRARCLLEEVRGELIAEGYEIPARVPVGVMIEVPAAAIMADRFAAEVDFFSIGTNDLIQYAMAADRADESVAYLSSGADPSILRLIERVVEAARARGIEVNICGSMGGDPHFVPLLLGLGIRHLSMSPAQVSEIKNLVRVLDTSETAGLVEHLKELDTANDVMNRLKRFLEDTLTRTGRAGATPSEDRAG